jgi:aconitate hydratase
MSPPLVVAFALAGRVDLDLARDSLGKDREGRDVFLRELWPSLGEIRDAMQSALKPEIFRKLYRDFADQNPKWNEITASSGDVYEWDEASNYIHDPPFFADFSMHAGTIEEIRDARSLGIFGDSVTTDHISPAGAIKANSPAGKYLQSRGIKPEDFNSYGSRRGNDLVMTRGTFANVRIKNLMVPGVEGGVTIHQPSGEQMSIFDAAEKYRVTNTPLVILAGHEYGTGSSRDWAAKGTRLLGVRAVVAASYERIHRSNLVGMGVLPLQFLEGTNAQSLGLNGSERYSVAGLNDSIRPGQNLTLQIKRANGETQEVPAKLRIDTAIEIDYYQHGGILPFVLRELLAR